MIYKFSHAILILTHLLFFASAYPAYAEGGVSGGGGSRIATAFRARGFELIRKVSKNSEANRLCASSILESSLRGTKVRAVGELLDPKTQKPVQGKDDAWTTPGDIQLLKSTWEGFLSEDGAAPVKSVDHLILHEILRSTASACPDDKYELSDRMMQVLGQPSLRVFQFPYLNDLWGHWLLCELKFPTPEREGEIYSGGMCADTGEYFNTTLKRNVYLFRLARDYKAITRKNSNDSGLVSGYHSVKSSFFSLSISKAAYDRIQILSQLTSETKPFLIVIDEDSGELSIGLNPDKLNPVELL